MGIARRLLRPDKSGLAMTAGPSESSGVRHDGTFETAKDGCSEGIGMRRDLVGNSATELFSEENTMTG